MLNWLRKLFKKDPPKVDTAWAAPYTGTVAPPPEPWRQPLTKLKPDTPPPVRKAASKVPTPPIHRKPIPRYYTPPSPAPAPAPSSSFGAGDFLAGMAVGSLLTSHVPASAREIEPQGGSFGGGGASGSWDSCSPSSSDSSSSSSDSCSSSSSSD